MNLPYGTVYELCDYQFYQIHVPVYIYRCIKEAVYRVCLVFKLKFFFLFVTKTEKQYMYTEQFEIRSVTNIHLKYHIKIIKNDENYNYS